jgi:pimeloyl-ACP methyl ester carboxylesterase
MPLLVIEGDQSMNGALAAQARLISDNVKAVKFTAAGHWLMEERPADTARELKVFLEKN